jgi:hypothetical protein
MKEEKKEKLPIDARLLTDAVIELNISRRTIGLYPADHPFIREALERAYNFFQKLFELRVSITLGIARDTLVIDEYILERKNPVFREFAMSIHSKGIASVMFISGLSMDELFNFFELIASRETPVGQGLVEFAEKKGISHIRLVAIDISKFAIVEDQMREGGSGSGVWEDYIYGLIEGKLAESDAEIVILNIPPQDIANALNEYATKETPQETYDRVITLYLRKKEVRIRKDLMSRFLSLVENLGPNLKQQILKRAFSQPAGDQEEIEKILSELIPDDLERVFKVFKEHASLIPERLKNYMDKLKKTRAETSHFDLLEGKKGYVDDIEVEEGVLKLFKEDNYRSFVSERYQKELEKMMKGVAEARVTPLSEDIEHNCRTEAIDRSASEVMLELLDVEYIGRIDYLTLLTKLSDFANDFLETGRFQEIAEIYNTLYSTALKGNFTDESSSMVEYFFRSEAFISKLVEAIKLWGRHDRAGVLRLANLLRLYVINPLIEALAEEQDSAIRRFLLTVLSSLGSDVIPEVMKRLNDERWYVVRNMIYLIRECGGPKQAHYVRPFAKHKDRKVCIEAVKTLLHFNTPDALPIIKFYLRSDDLEMRNLAIRLAGSYKVKEVLPFLTEILDKRDPFGTEAHYRISAVKALSEIGDPKALETLKRVYKSKPLLFRSAHEDLRVEIFRNLHKFPSHAARPLIELGMKSKNREIKSISEQLIKGSGDGHQKGL